MKPLRILSPALTLLGEVDHYLSLSFTRRFHRPGEFQLVTSRKMDSSSQLRIGQLVMLEADPTQTALIQHLEIRTGEEGEETLFVTGETLAGIVQQRITFPPTDQAQDIQEGDAESVMKHYVQRNCLDIAAMAFSHLMIAPSKHRGETIKWQSRYQNLAEELEKISLSTGIGWVIYPDFDTGNWVFDVAEGRDLTVHQGQHPPVIFSPEFENIKAQAYMDSLKNYADVAVVAGQGEGVDREIVIIESEKTGLERHVIFVDARDIENPEDLPARGENKLREHQRLQTFQSEILAKGPFKYRRDWDLGDMVTVQNQAWQMTLASRITEVTEIYEVDGYRLEVTFGNQVPILAQKIKNEMEALKKESTR